MRRCLICLLLAGAFFPLGAQTDQAVSIFMPPFTGTGMNERDSAFFYMFIYHELETKENYTMGRASYSTDFSLTGALSPIRTTQTSSFTECFFYLTLQDNKTGEVLSEQRYRYSRLDNAEIAIRTMLDNVYNLIKTSTQPVQPTQKPAQPTQQPFEPPQQPYQQPYQQPTQPYQQPNQPYQQPNQPYQQPNQPFQPIQPVQQPAQPNQQPVQQPVEQPVQQPVETVQPPVQQPIEPNQPAAPEVDDDWRERWLFLGLSVCWNPKIYMGEGPAYNLTNPNVGFHTEFHALSSVSLETGLVLSPEWVTISEDADFRDLLLEVPLLVKITLKPSGHYMLEPYSGVSFNFSLFSLTRPSMVSWVAGYQHGVKAGPGAFLFDFRFAMDLSTSSLVKHPDIYYKRYSVAFGIGYKYGIMPK